MHQGVEDYNVQTSRNIGVFCIHPLTADAETTAPCDDSHVVVVICLSSLIIIIIIIIIILYVYHALINALSARMIHINLNI